MCVHQCQAFIIFVFIFRLTTTTLHKKVNFCESIKSIKINARKIKLSHQNRCSIVNVQIFQYSSVTVNYTFLFLFGFVNQYVQLEKYGNRTANGPLGCSTRYQDGLYIQFLFLLQCHSRVSMILVQFSYRILSYIRVIFKISFKNSE